ncbi:hypothetical protein D3C71_1423170 [compost metagenome]
MCSPPLDGSEAPSSAPATSGACASVEMSWAKAGGSRRTRISRKASANWPEMISRFSSA